jgi:hypothetical protein
MTQPGKQPCFNDIVRGLEVLAGPPEELCSRMCPASQRDISRMSRPSSRPAHD